MIIKIPFKTPTVNHLYGQHGKYKYLKSEAKQLREQIKEIVEKDLDNLEFAPHNVKPLKVVVYIYEDWYCKNGSVKRVDADNRAKFLLDSVFNSLGIDDRYIFSLTMIKEQSFDSECSIIEITPL